MLNVSCSHNNHVFTIVHPIMKPDDHIPRYFMNVVYFSQYWQAHHVVPVYVEIHILHESLKSIIICGLKFLPNSIFLKFYVESLVLAVTKHVA